MSTVAKHPRATTITINSLGIFLGLLHVLFGVVALTAVVSLDYHREMKANYNAFSKNLSFLHSVVDRVSLALYLRYLTSALQISFGSLLLHFGSYSKIGNFGLIGVDVSFLLLQLLSGASYERVAPTIVFTVLLTARLLIVEQSSKKVKVGVKTRNAGKPKTSTPKKNKNE